MHVSARRRPPAPRAQGEALPFNTTPGHSTAHGRRLLACNMAIYFKNVCELPIKFAIRGRLQGNVDSDHCRDGAVNAGEWCSRAWFTMAPGQEAYPLRTDNTVFYYWASARDDKGRTVFWTGDADNGDTNYYDTSSGSPCSKGSSSTCRLFRKVRPLWHRIATGIGNNLLQGVAPVVFFLTVYESWALVPCTAGGNQQVLQQVHKLAVMQELCGLQHIQLPNI